MPDEEPAPEESSEPAAQSSERILESEAIVSYSYIYASGKLLQEKVTTDGTTETHNFFYDNSGKPYAMQVNGTTYYYVTNLQGDVMGMVDTSGNSVASYTYDPYGKVLTATGTLAEKNPLRYRGYYYDSESGLYYLKSRYYDPATRRFVNADSYSSTGQGLLGCNMFAYCNNNPVLYHDTDGTIAITTLILVGSIIVGAVAAAYTAYTETKAGCDTAQIINDSLLNGLCAFSIVYSGGMMAYQCYQNFCYLNAMTPVTEVGPSSQTVEEQLQACADTANSSVSGNGPTVGTQKHKVFATEVDSLGNPALKTEVSYSGGREVAYGTRGSIRFDVMLFDEGGTPIQAWDFKTGSAVLTASRIEQMQTKSGLLGLQITMIK